MLDRHSENGQADGRHRWWRQVDSWDDWQTSILPSACVLNLEASSVVTSTSPTNQVTPLRRLQTVSRIGKGKQLMDCNSQNLCWSMNPNRCWVLNVLLVVSACGTGNTIMPEVNKEALIVQTRLLQRRSCLLKHEIHIDCFWNWYGCLLAVLLHRHCSTPEVQHH